MSHEYSDTHKRQTHTHTHTKCPKPSSTTFSIYSSKYFMKLISFYTLNNPASYSLFPLISNTDKTKNLRI